MLLGSSSIGDSAIGDPVATPMATMVTVSPASGLGSAVGVASSAITVSHDGASAADTITPSDGGGGTFSPTSQTVTGVAAATFIYTPATAGTKALTFASSLGLTAATMSYAVSATRPATTKTITVAIKDASGNAIGDATGIKWKWFDTADPASLMAPADSGSSAAFSGGNLTLIVHTALSSGGLGTLLLSNSDGTPTQLPAANVALHVLAVP